MCLITVPIEFWLNKSIQISPTFETIFLFSENDLSPIILLDPLILRSNTGSVLIFTPICFRRYEDLSINNL